MDVFDLKLKDQRNFPWTIAFNMIFLNRFEFVKMSWPQEFVFFLNLNNRNKMSENLFYKKN